MDTYRTYSRRVYSQNRIHMNRIRLTPNLPLAAGRRYLGLCAPLRLFNNRGGQRPQTVQGHLYVYIYIHMCECVCVNPRSLLWLQDGDISACVNRFASSTTAVVSDRKQCKDIYMCIYMYIYICVCVCVDPRFLPLATGRRYIRLC